MQLLRKALYDRENGQQKDQDWGAWCVSWNRVSEEESNRTLGEKCRPLTELQL